MQSDDVDTGATSFATRKARSNGGEPRLISAPFLQGRKVLRVESVEHCLEEATGLTARRFGHVFRASM